MFTQEVSTADDPPADAPTGWDDFAVLTPAPPDESFWRKHNRHLEMPTSLVLSLFIMAGAFAVFALLMLYAIGPGPEKPMPPMSFVSGGADEAGQGNANAGESGQDRTMAQPTTTAEPIQPSEDKVKPLPDVTTPPTPSPTADTGDLNPSEPKESAFEGLMGATQKILLPGSGGNGDGKGKSGTGTEGGEKGIGADMTKARSLRWVMKFETAGGRDYLDQLHALGAVVLVPVPGSQNEFYLFRDLKNPRAGVKATDTDMIQFQSQVQFSDSNRDTLSKLAPALGLNFMPSEFYAVFPKGLERELADKERAYRNWRPEDIAATRFQVVRAGGAYRLAVVSQTRR